MHSLNSHPIADNSLLYLESAANKIHFHRDETVAPSGVHPGQQRFPVLFQHAFILQTSSCFI